MTRLKLFLEPEVHTARKHLPGNLRQHLKRIIEGLADEPRPPRSKALDTGGLNVPSEVELRRLRIERWRVVYALNESEGWIWVLAVRHRPPYDYEDIKELILRLE